MKKIILVEEEFAVKKPPEKRKSKYKGVYFDKRSEKWWAAIKTKEKNIYLGSFTDEDAAAKAYDKAAIKHFGDKAILNFQEYEEIEMEGEDIVKIPLRNSKKFAIINKEDLEKVKIYPWRIDPNGYPFGGKKLLHHLILPQKEGYNVTHKNDNLLDNRKKNLEYSTVRSRSEKRKMNRNNLYSYYKGVSYKKSQSSWSARINFKGKRYDLGYFTSEENAALAYDKKAKEFNETQGAKFVYNFPTIHAQIQQKKKDGLIETSLKNLIEEFSN